MRPVHVIGGGLAGCEAAWQIARAGVPVVLHEMRPHVTTDAHRTDGLAELVCSNSFRSDDAEYNAVGLLHEEMRRSGSLILQCGDRTRLPAGGALAVDRDRFSAAVAQALAADPLVTIERGEIAGLPPARVSSRAGLLKTAAGRNRPPARVSSRAGFLKTAAGRNRPPEDWDSVIVATGPLTSDSLSAAIRDLTGEDSLAFFDAIAPILYLDSVDMSKAWKQSRYDKGSGADYINCALDREQYETFVAELRAAEKIEFHEWEGITPYFEGCLPIEVMAERGMETLRYGPMKPVGLTDPHSPVRPHAVVQLRQDNALGTLYNMVGFQTKLKYGEQTRLFRTIPGLENARFARLGGIHRNTFLNSPKLLDGALRLKREPRLRFAGQITGVEGYIESAAIGLLAGRFAAAERLDQAISPPPATTALGALLAHITGGAVAESFQPMNVNFGLFPPLADTGKRGPRGRERKRAQSVRALADLDRWLGTRQAAE